MTTTHPPGVGDARLPSRFWQKLRTTEAGCWEWLAQLNHHGYAQYWFNGRTRAAHRVSYEVLVAPIPQGLQIDHLCRNRACVNPAHLEPVTGLANMRRGVNALKQHCVNGHEFTPENTLPRKGRDGRRACRACKRERTRVYRATRRAQARAARRKR